MADYKVSTLIETNAGQVARDVDKAAASIERVGTSSASASGGTNALTLAQQRLDLANRKVIETGTKVERMQRLGATSTSTYTVALERHLRAQQAVLTETAKIERLQNRTQSGGGRSGSGGLAGLAVGGVAGYVTGQAVGRYLMDSKDAASSLNETLAKSQRLFGPYSASVEQFGKSANTQLGLSKQAAIEAAASFGTLFAGVGLGQGATAQLSTGLTKLAADLGAYAHDTDATKATGALTQALHGQFDTLAHYGVVLTTADVKQKALQLGLIATTKDALTPAATAQAVYALAMERSTTQTGTFTRRAGEAAEKTQILAATSENAKAAIGQSLLPVMNDLTGIAQHDLIPALNAAADALGFLGRHDTVRHIGELALLMVGLAKAVDITAASYGRLTATATTAAVAETEAAVAGPAGSKGALSRLFAGGVRGVGTRTVIGAAVGTGAVLVAEGFQTDQRKLLRQGAIARGTRSGFDSFSQPYSEQVGHKLGGALGFVGLGGVSRALDRATGYSYDIAAGTKVAQDKADADARAAVATARAISGSRTLMSRRLDARQQSTSAALALANDPNEQARIAGAAGAALDSPFAVLASRAQGDVAATREAKRKADRAVAAAQRAYDKASRGSGGASASSLLSAEASVRSAEAALQKRGGNGPAEQARLAAAEARLAELRRKGGVDTDKLRAAEDRLTEARHNARGAADDAKKAAATTALGLSDVLGRVTGQAKDSRAKRDDVRKLIHAGVTEPVIEELAKLEQQAPGTFDRLAKEVTPALAKQLNGQYAALTTFQKQYQDEIVQYAKRSAEASADAVVAAYAARGIAIRAANVDPNEHGAPRPPGVAAGVTTPPPPAPAHHAPAAPVVVAPRTTHHTNIFPNVRTDAEIQASLAKRERLDALR